MGNSDRYRRQKESERNKGQPLGGGLDPAPAAPLAGAASVLELQVVKPVEQEGRRGLLVRYRLRVGKLAGLKLVLETTLHEQGRGPLGSRLPSLANTQGQLERWEVFTPAGDAPTETEQAAFVPFEALEVDRAGTIKCFARVRVLEAERGCLAQAEEAFVIEAG